MEAPDQLSSTQIALAPKGPSTHDGHDPAGKAGERHRVFCASMADVFDNRAPAGARERLWELIRQTPHLDWLLLTKRPQNIAKMLPADWGKGYPNIWLGVTVENQTEADRRIPILRRIPGAVRFLSCEPLLEEVRLTEFVDGGIEMPGIHRIICGGESGPGARPMHPDWARHLRDDCLVAGVAFHFKQWGRLGTGCPHHRRQRSDIPANGGRHVDAALRQEDERQAAGRLRVE
jgi:protein gp37